MSYQAIETFRFGFYDLYKQKIFFNNTDVSILDRREEKCTDKCFSTRNRFSIGRCAKFVAHVRCPTATSHPVATIVNFGKIEHSQCPNKRAFFGCHLTQH